LTAALLLAAALPACAGQSSPPAPSVPVTEKDFAITGPATLQSGPVNLRVENDGPIQHELIIVRSATGTLPLRSDGITADEEALDSVTVASLGPGPTGEVRELKLNLAPGQYLLFCNMDGHYLAGMHATLVVS
jgi:uncharacterized cupredoxin-like copper-binding protein